MVTRQEREALGNGMGYDDMITGVAVVLRLVELELGGGKGRVASQWQDLYAVVLLNGGEHLLGCLPVFGQECLVVEMYNKLACRLETGLWHRFWVIENVPEFKSRLVGTCYQVDNGASVKQ